MNDMRKQEITVNAVPDRFCLRYLLWLGIIAPLFIVAMVLIAAAVTPGYSHLYRAVSTLGIVGIDIVPHPAVFNVSIIAYGLMMIAYAYGVYHLLGRNRDAKAIAILLIVHAVGILFVGIFHDEILYAGEVVSAEAIIHTTFAVASYFALLVLMCLFCIMTWRNSDWKGIIWFTSVIIIASLPLVGLFIFKEGRYLGLFQRVGYGVTLFWVFVFTLKLLWLSRKSPGDHAR